MERLLLVLTIVAPIFTAVLLGMLAKRKALLNDVQISGLQQFVVKFGLPCVLFGSCFSAQITAETITSIAMVIPMWLISSFWAYRMRKSKYPYHNLPMMFSAQESGMLGIPLFIALFGASNAYYLGMLDLAQSFIAIPVIAILTTNTGENPSVYEIIKKVFQSPLLIMSFLGLFLNLSGIANGLDAIGLKAVISETAAFIAEPVSASMLFTVGYNFSISKGNQKTIFKLSTIHFVTFFAFSMIMQGILFLLPNVNPLTRYAILLFGVLPSSYLSTSMGKTKEEYAISSGVCSILTLITLCIFCIMTFFIS